MAQNRFAALKADTDVFTTFEGDNTVLMQLVAKSLLTDYKDQFGELDPLGMMGFVAGQVIDTVLERLFARKVAQVVVDAVPSREESADPLQRDYQLTLFRWREEHIVAGLARRLKTWIDRGEDPFEVFIACQDHVVAAGQAHIDRVVLEAFDHAIGRCEDADHAAALDRLCSLHALANVERDRGWFQEHGRISAQRSKAITRAVGKLCYELRAEAEPLVDAFGVPEAVLGPIARDA
jgi:acyl-CoA oxidase